MERPKNIRSNRAIRIQNQRTNNAVRLVIIFHLVGLVGLLVNFSRPIFLHLVPFHLLLMALVLFFTHDKPGTKFILFFTLLFITGFGIEWAGVHTGKLFGNYAYGPTLGLKINGIPVIIGINWFLLIYSAGVTLQHTRVKSIWLRVITGAALLVLLDVLIEPVAIRLNYWHWQSNRIPVDNYVCWFIVSVVLLFVFEKFHFKKQSIVGPALLVSQFIFFAALQ